MKKVIPYIFFVIVIILLLLLFINNTKHHQNVNIENNDNNQSTVAYEDVLPWEIYRKTDGNKEPKENYSKKILDKYNGLSYKQSNSRELFLTFDVGYESGHTEEILNIVNECKIKVAFFITDAFYESNPQLVGKMIDDGHIVGNHTVHHYDMTKLSDEDIKNELLELHNKVKDKFSYEMKYFRPPEGLFSEKVLDVTKSIGYRAVIWGLAYDDWDENNQKGEEYAKHMIFDNVRSGQVILLHASSKDNLSILEEFITHFKSKGYRFKTLDDY